MTTLPMFLSVDLLVFDPEGSAWAYLTAAELSGLTYWNKSLETDALWRDKEFHTPYLATRLRALATCLEPSQADQCEVLAGWIASQRNKAAKVIKPKKKAAV